MTPLEGRDARRAVRAKTTSKVANEIRELLFETGIATVEGGKLVPNPDLTSERAGQAQLEAKAGIEAYFKGAQAKKMAYRTLGEEWQKLMAQAQLNVPPELPTIALPSPSSMVTPLWMAMARESHAWRDQLNKTLSEIAQSTSRADLNSLAAASAIFNGLLLNPNHVLAFHNALDFGTLKLRPSYGGWIAANFNRRTMNGLAHRVIGEHGHEDITFIPDGVTLGIIVRLLTRKEQQAAANNQPQSRRAQKSALFHLIQLAMWGPKPPSSPIGSLHDLCAIGHWPRVGDGVDLSHALIAAMTGATPSVSLAVPDNSSFQTNADSKLNKLSAKQLISEGSISTSAQHLGEIADEDVLKLEEIIAISAQRGLKREVSANLRAALYKVIETAASGSVARFLTDYLGHLVLTQKRKTSTFHTYATRLLHPLAIAFGDIDIHSLGADDFEDLYQIALDQKLTTTSRAYCARVLTALHSFGTKSEEYRLPPLNATLHEGTHGLTIVRAAVPNSQVVERSKANLRNQGPLGQTLALIMDTAFRSGLRIGEICKLRLKDVQIFKSPAPFLSVRAQSQEPKSNDILRNPAEPLQARPGVWVWVTQNKFGDNKTVNARRKIPISALMSDVELEEFIVHYNRRRTNQSLFTGELLFEADELGTPFHPRGLSAALSDAMRQASNETAWTVHHLRHAAFNCVQLAIEQEDALASELFGVDSDTCSRIRTTIVGDKEHDVRGYHALAKFASHASASQTWASYLHSMPWIVASRREIVPNAIPLAALAGATGITPRTLRERHATTQKEIAKLLATKLRPLLSAKIAPQNGIEKKLMSKDTIPTLTLGLIEAVLLRGQQSANDTEIAKDLGVKATTVGHILQGSRALQLKKGARGKTRVLMSTAEPVAGSPEPVTVLSLQPPRTKEGRVLASQIFAKIMTTDTNRHNQIRIVETILNGTNAHDAEVRIYHPGELRHIVMVLGSILPSDLWELEIRRRPGRDHALSTRRWRAAIGEQAKIQEVMLGADPNGKAETEAGTALIKVKLPTDKIDQPARATSALKYAAAMAWIALYKPAAE